MEEQAEAQSNRHTQAEPDMLCCMLLLFIFGLMVAHGKEAHHNRACTEAHGSKGTTSLERLWARRLGPTPKPQVRRLLKRGIGIQLDSYYVS